MDKKSSKAVFICMHVMSFDIILCSGQRKLGISLEDVNIYLEDDTEIDEDYIMLACGNGSAFGFWAGRDKWQMQSSCISSSGEHSGKGMWWQTPNVI